MKMEVILVPRAVRLFVQLESARRDSGIMEASFQGNVGVTVLMHLFEIRTEIKDCIIKVG